mmetsp:Transcript_30611/g.40110  ORF Transcript_30611/g.40110 Transcript_30611/m.40110 type:complete len:137 (+) Transcript_30611:473-883(+)
MFWTSYASCRGTNVSVRAVFFLQFWWRTGGGHFHCSFHHPRRTVTFGTCTVSSIGRIRSSTGTAQCLTVCILVLQKRSCAEEEENTTSSSNHPAPRLVPGGQPTLIALTAISVSLLSASTILALRHAVRAARLAFV